jgi:hypothetical protein
VEMLQTGYGEQILSECLNGIIGSKMNQWQTMACSMVENGQCKTGIRGHALNR